MTLTELLALPERERDTKIERLVFHTKLCPHIKDEYGKCSTCGLNKSHWKEVEPPRHFFNPAHDYAVLVRVRETWDVLARDHFAARLDRIWKDRRESDEGDPGFRGMYYTVGDYSLAALLALGDA